MMQWDVILQGRAGTETVRVEAASSEAAAMLAGRPGVYVSCITPVARTFATPKRKG